MEDSWWVGLIVAGISLVGVVFAAIVQRRPGKLHIRARIAADQEIRSRIPDDHPQAEALDDHIADNIKRMIDRETVERVDPMGIIIGAFLSVSGVYLGYSASVAEGASRLDLVLLWGLTIFMFTLGAYGFVRSVKKVERDDKNNPI